MNDLPKILSEIQKDITEIKVSQARTEQDLKHHIKRTDLAEENLKLLRDEMKPVKRHMAMWEGALKLLGVLSLMASLVYTLIRIFMGS